MAEKVDLGGMGLGCLIGLRAEIGCCGSALGEVSREDWLNQGAEDDLSTSTIRVSLNWWSFVALGGRTHPV